MMICRTKQQLREALENKRKQKPGLTTGFVPTMGYLHEGHASLIRRSVAECDLTVLSIFVNPLQFGPNEDFDRYPRDEQRDLALAEASGADIAFLPTVEEMYPTKPLTSITVDVVTDRLCGASRPGHFDGVGVVVSKLFNLVQPQRAYFGMKDAQQVAVIRRMTDDLDMPIKIVPCDIVREPDGLALSSRNVYLSAEERSQALVLSQSLAKAKSIGETAGKTVQGLIDEVSNHIRESQLADIDYVELLAYPNLTPLAPNQLLLETPGELLLAVAVKFGRTRLIDNRILSFSEVTIDV
ncbi:pantoate--beta-alanine ligase [Paenibacillus cellulosilyticus]|uniref:pantoate--beta-alanine ligase n=1 Tax=Paenibacillus cellulosilyticus TaxID=375489 RepID=UPI000D70B164|nr:pantoate--beta-alanine ligase [Paenibacillus cellulosilyticus]QKS46557.1 pantoate--beta-alanine ligase [Paenibacillus cellulosilyticus]